MVQPSPIMRARFAAANRVLNGVLMPLRMSPSCVPENCSPPSLTSLLPYRMALRASEGRLMYSGGAGRSKASS